MPISSGRELRLLILIFCSSPFCHSLLIDSRFFPICSASFRKVSASLSNRVFVSVNVHTDAPRPAWGGGPGNWAIAGERDRQSTDIVITKRQWGAFYGTELDLQLRRRGGRHHRSLRHFHQPRGGKHGS